MPHAIKTHTFLSTIYPSSYLNIFMTRCIEIDLLWFVYVVICGEIGKKQNRKFVEKTEIYCTLYVISAADCTHIRQGKDEMTREKVQSTMRVNSNGKTNITFRKWFNLLRLKATICIRCDHLKSLHIWNAFECEIEIWWLCVTLGYCVRCILHCHTYFLYLNSYIIVPHPSI